MNDSKTLKIKVQNEVFIMYDSKTMKIKVQNEVFIMYDSKTMKIKVQNKALYLFQNSVVIMHTRIPIHLTQVPGVYRKKIWL